MTFVGTENYLKLLFYYAVMLDSLMNKSFVLHGGLLVTDSYSELNKMPFVIL